MATPFLGEIYMLGFSFAPRGYALCDGQLLSIQQNAALFALLGTYYGGNGVQTFALPDLRGRAPIHQGQGPGLSNYSMGQSGGQENHTLTQGEMPQHTHQLQAYGSAGTSRTAQNNLLGSESQNKTSFYAPVPPGSPNVLMSPQSLANAGGTQPHNNMQPYLVINFSIALAGIFPSRN